MGGASEERVVHLDLLICRYWSLLRIFYIATFPSLASDAVAWLQDSAGDEVPKAGWLKTANSERGKFRHFLKARLRNFALDRLNRSSVRNARLPFDAIGGDLPAEDGPDEGLDLAGARIVKLSTLHRIEADCNDPNKDQLRRRFIWKMSRVRLPDQGLNGHNESQRPNPTSNRTRT
jgi:hypothetical protein